MADFSKLIITDAGKRLLNLKLNSQQELSFTEMAMSECKYDMDTLPGLTSLEGIQQRAGIRKISRKENSIQIDSVFLNSDLEKGYFANTLGVYACLGADEPVLFAVAAEQVSAAYMPRKSRTLSGIEIKLKITLENAENITIQMDQSAMATVGDVLELEDHIGNHVADFDNPHHVTKAQVGLDKADNTADVDKPVSAAQQEALNHKVDKVAGKGLSKNDYTDVEKAKLQGIEEKANHYTHPDTHPATMIDQDADHRFVSDSKRQEWDGVYTQATGYTDQKIADLINGAPGTLDTLGEIAQAMQDNKDVVQALDQAIGTKASQAELDGHTGNNTIHITASERRAWNDKQTKTGDTKDNVVTFTSGDSATPTGWTDVGVIGSGEKHSSLWRKVSLFAKNVRYLWKLMGSTSLNGIGDGTVTGAISSLNTGLSDKQNNPSTGSFSFNVAVVMAVNQDLIVKYDSHKALHICFMLKSNVAATVSITVGTIPVGYRPTRNITCSCNGSGGGCAVVVINTNGNVIITPYNSSGFVDSETVSIDIPCFV